MHNDNPGPAHFVVLVTYGKFPNTIYAEGLFEHEAVILQRIARKLGYNDAQVTTKASVLQAREVERERQRLARESRPSDRVLHDMRPLTNIPLAR